MLSSRLSTTADLNRWAALLPSRDGTERLSIGVKERDTVEVPVGRCLEDNDGT